MRHFIIQRNVKDIGWDIIDGATGRPFRWNSFQFEHDARAYCTQYSERSGEGIRVTVDCRSPFQRESSNAREASKC